MTARGGRRTPLSPETKAQVLADLLTGETVHGAARHAGVSRPAVRRLRALLAEDDDGARRGIDPLLEALVSASLETLIAQARQARDPAWVLAQSPRELARFTGMLHDRVFRMLAAAQVAEAAS
jgi:transposase-like protein